jgi:hypothetical protein
MRLRVDSGAYNIAIRMLWDMRAPHGDRGIWTNERDGSRGTQSVMHLTQRPIFRRSVLSHLTVLELRTLSIAPFSQSQFEDAYASSQAPLTLRASVASPESVNANRRKCAFSRALDVQSVAPADTRRPYAEHPPVKNETARPTSPHASQEATRYPHRLRCR